MSPKSALTDLRLRAEAAEPASQGGRRLPILERLEVEKRILVKWAQEKGLMLPADQYLSQIEDTHGEHHVYYDTGRALYFKITHGVDGSRAGFALTVGTISYIGKKTQKNISKPRLREATPFEYLARVQLFNLVFQDSIELEGVIIEPGKEAFVISQPYIIGEPASESDVAEFMTKRSFAPVPGVSFGKGNTVSYFRESDRVAVFDTHGQNFLVSGSNIVPIDALIITASDELETYLILTADEREAEGV